MVTADALNLAPHDDDDALTPDPLAALAPNAAKHAREMTPATTARTTAAHGPAVTATALGFAPHTRPSPDARCPTLAALAAEVSR